MIRYVDLAAQNGAIEADLVAALRRVVQEGRPILGQQVDRFERRLASLVGVPWALGVGSGTDALVIALRALDVGPGDEVVTVPNSFVATVAAIAAVGATPVLVDVDREQLMDPGQLERAITPATRVIVPVHLNGRVADMPAIVDIARTAGAAVLEDCAQAIGASLDGISTGAFGVLGCYSFHPLKNLGALGDGGAVVGRDETHRERIRLLRNHGLRDRDTCERWGANARLDTLQAAFLDVKLDHLPAWTERRRRIAEHYLRELGDLPVELPCPRPGEHCIWSGFVIQADDRDELRRSLLDAGVEALIYYPVPIHLQPAAHELGRGPGSFPAAERQARRILSLPVRAELGDAEVEHIVRAVRAHYRSRGSAP